MPLAERPSVTTRHKTIEPDTVTPRQRGETDLDYIEAFTPAPTTDMTVTQAREAWPDKVLWLNFPCEVHLQPEAEIAAVAMDLVDQAQTPNGLLMGITDNVPENRWRQSFTAIMDGLEQHARDHGNSYTAREN